MNKKYSNIFLEEDKPINNPAQAEEQVNDNKENKNYFSEVGGDLVSLLKDSFKLIKMIFNSIKAKGMAGLETAKMYFFTLDKKVGNVSKKVATSSNITKAQQMTQQAINKSKKGNSMKGAKIVKIALNSVKMDSKRINSGETKKVMNAVNKVETKAYINSLFEADDPNTNEEKIQNINEIKNYLINESKILDTTIGYLKTLWGVIKLIFNKIWRFLTSFFSKAKQKVDSMVDKEAKQQNTKNQTNNQSANQNATKPATNQNTTQQAQQPANNQQQTQQELNKYINNDKHYTFDPTNYIIENIMLSTENKNNNEPNYDDKWEVFKAGIIGAFYRLILTVVFNGLLIYMMKYEGMEIPSYITENNSSKNNNYFFVQEGAIIEAGIKGVFSLLIKGINFLFGGFFKKTWGVLTHLFESQNINSVIMVLFATGWVMELFYFLKDIYLSMKYVVIAD